MTTLQHKAILEAVELLESVRNRALFPDNYTTIEQMKLAVQKQREELDRDMSTNYEALRWLRAVLADSAANES